MRPQQLACDGLLRGVPKAAWLQQAQSDQKAMLQLLTASTKLQTGLPRSGTGRLLITLTAV